MSACSETVAAWGMYTVSGNSKVSSNESLTTCRLGK